MTVSPAKQFYYCFSCGAGGNSIKFLMEFQRLSFSDVVLDLARKYQVPIETIEGPQQERFRQQLSRREGLYKVLSLANAWFRDQLRTPEGENALHYLLNDQLVLWLKDATNRGRFPLMAIKQNLFLS